MTVVELMLNRTTRLREKVDQWQPPPPRFIIDAGARQEDP